MDLDPFVLVAADSHAEKEGPKILIFQWFLSYLIGDTMHAVDTIRKHGLLIAFLRPADMPFEGGGVMLRIECDYFQGLWACDLLPVRA